MAQFSLVCDGIAWTGWLDWSVRQSMDQAAHSFTFSTTDKLQAGLARWNVKGGSRVEFFIDKLKVVEGYVRKYSPSISEDNHSIRIEGDSAAIDLVESSHIGPYFWKSGVAAKTAIDDVLKPFGASVQIDGTLTAFDKAGFRVGANDSPFEIIRQIAERDKKTVYTASDGKLVITDEASATEAGRIARGAYIAVSADHDLTNNYSAVHVKSQSNDREEATKDNFTKKQQYSKVISNPVTGGRYRPLVFVTSGETEKKGELAAYLRSRFAGDVIAATVTVKSHLNPAGALWGVNQKIFLDEPLIDAKQALVTSEVEFSVSESEGYQTRLTLKLPETYDGSKPSGARLRLADDGAFLATLKGLVPES
jgi:prophage tail gpP-like protein